MENRHTVDRKHLDGYFFVFAFYYGITASYIFLLFVTSLPELKSATVRNRPGVVVYSTQKDWL